MNIRTVLHVISYLLFFLLGAQLLTVLVSLGLGDPGRVQIALLESSVVNAAVAGLMWYFTRGHSELTRRDGFAVVTLGWIFVAVIGALPYVFSRDIPDLISACFESMSGFTTTGASVMSNLESVPRGILFWRSITQWFGGMGVLVLCIAILPFLKTGAMQLYQAEIPGPNKERLTPHIVTTAKLLWVLYLAFTVLQTLLLMLGGMDWFESVCHSFTTMSTGGFSTRSASVAAFDSVYIETVIIIFMLLAGVNFSLHFHLVRGRPGVYFKDSEFKVFALAWIAATLCITWDIWQAGLFELGEAFRAAIFTSSTIVTTTGFGTADFDVWPGFAKLIILGLMLTGACAGSTSGGIKFVRVGIMVKISIRELKRFIRPHAVYKVKINKRSVDEAVLSNVTAFVMIFMLIFAIGSVMMTFFTPDLESAVSSVAATLGNIGPGFGAVGPTQNFAIVAPLGKIILTGLMLLGRLELFTLLVILSPEYWRK